MATSEIVSAERLFKALGNRRRIAIVRMLKRKKEASVGEIADEIKLSFKATSKHIAVLAGAGLLEREQRSLNMYYKISSELTTIEKAALTIL